MPVNRATKAARATYRGAGDGSQAGEATRKYGRRGGISGHHEIARRTKDGERDEGKQKRIEAGDDRSAGNFGVAKRLRNVHGRKRKSGQKILRYLRPLKRPQPLEERKAIHATARASGLYYLALPFPYSMSRSSVMAN